MISVSRGRTPSLGLAGRSRRDRNRTDLVYPVMGKYIGKRQESFMEAKRAESFASRAAKPEPGKHNRKAIRQHRTGPGGGERRPCPVQMQKSAMITLVMPSTMCAWAHLRLLSPASAAGRAIPSPTCARPRNPRNKPHLLCQWSRSTPMLDSAQAVPIKLRITPATWALRLPARASTKSKASSF